MTPFVRLVTSLISQTSHIFHPSQISQELCIHECGLSCYSRKSSEIILPIFVFVFPWEKSKWLPNIHLYLRGSFDSSAPSFQDTFALELFLALTISDTGREGTKINYPIAALLHIPRDPRHTDFFTIKFC